MVCSHTFTKRSWWSSKRCRRLGLDGTVPVFDTVREAVEKSGANTSCIFVPAAGPADAIAEAARGQMDGLLGEAMEILSGIQGN